MNRLGWPFNNDKDFSKISKPAKQDGAYICNSTSRNCFRLMRDWKLENLRNGKEILVVPFRTKKRTTSEGTPQFPNGISGKLPYHLTWNRNFWIFLPNGKHPLSMTRPVSMTWINARVNRNRIHKVPSWNCNHRLVYLRQWHIQMRIDRTNSVSLSDNTEQLWSSWDSVLTLSFWSDGTNLSNDLY